MIYMRRELIKVLLKRVHQMKDEPINKNRKTSRTSLKQTTKNLNINGIP